MPYPNPKPLFTLHGCWEVWELMGKPKNIETMIHQLESSVESNPSFAFDVAKSLVESTCKTIFEERSISYDKDWDIPKLLKETFKILELIPDGHENDVADMVKQVAGGLVNSSTKLGELRNRFGSIGHGRAAFARELEPIQAVFAAKSADTVMHFIYTAHQTYPPIVRPSKPEYVDEPDFNQTFDDEEGLVVIRGIEYSPSELLFYADKEAYRAYLQEYEDVKNLPVEADL